MNKDVEHRLKIMENNIEKQLNELEEYLEENSEFGRLVTYLLTTERNPYSIINGGYSQDHISFLNLVRDLHHSIYDDGDITLYTINDAPRISLKYNFTTKDSLSDFEKQLEKNYSSFKSKDFKLYEFKKLPYDIDNWIKLSEEFHYNDIKSAL